VLIAAEWPIYGRFGYAPATLTASHTYYPRRRNASITAVDGGTVRHVMPQELMPLAAGIFDRARRRRQGQVDRRGPWWAKRLGQDGFETIGPQPHWLLHTGPDGPDGLLAWRVTRDFELDGAMGAIEVSELVAASDLAYQNFWAYLSGIDVVDEITLRESAPDEAVRWLVRDGRVLRQTYLGDDTWLRLLDVPAALSARGYATTDRLVLEVVDAETGGYAAGIYALDATADAASCTPTTGAIDLRLSQRVLASAYLGAYSLRQLAPGGGVEERTRGAMARFDALFATPLIPWNATGF
jgi:predicted acetyltransferase